MSRFAAIAGGVRPVEVNADTADRDGNTPDDFDPEKFKAIGERPGLAREGTCILVKMDYFND